MMNRRRVLFPLLLAVLLMVLASGVAMGKGHVPAGKVQVSHKGVVRQVSAEALGGHLNHGDIQLPACDSAPLHTFFRGDDASGVTDTTGDGKADSFPNGLPYVLSTSPACAGGLIF